MLCELNHQADELIGLEADNSGSFGVYFDRTAVESNKNSSLFGLLFCSVADTI